MRTQNFVKHPEPAVVGQFEGYKASVEGYGL